MSSFQAVAQRIKDRKQLVVAYLIIGSATVAALIFLVPSQLGFALVGPLVFVPWCLFCIVVAHKPTALAMVWAGTCVLIGLAWPLLYL